MSTGLTDEQVKFIAKQREKGAEWSSLQSSFNHRYDTDYSPDGLRHAYRRANVVPKAKVERKPLVMPPGGTDRRKGEDNTRILFISDMHEPYGHPDTFAFLSALKAKYEPTRVICLGDEADKHAMSFHDSDPDLPSAGDELKLAIKKLEKIYKLFPVVDLVDSNHGSMHYRKGKHHGIPRKYLRGYNEILEAPAGWGWRPDLTLTLPDGNPLYVCHCISSNVMKVVNQRGTCVVQGHVHTGFSIGYSGNPSSLLWGIQSGCLIDKRALAFAYDNANLGRPIIGTSIVIDSQPRLLPMVLNKGGRWTGVTP
jgi:hypothetical protein